MHSFLGVPIAIRGQVWGNLYLTEKQGGDEFSPADEEAAVILARWAATAIENARLYEASSERRAELEQAVRALEAAGDIADAIGGVAELDRVLELIVKRGRALVEARSVLIMLREGDELVLAASAGHASGANRQRLPIAGSTSGQVLERGRCGADRRCRRRTCGSPPRSWAFPTRRRRCSSRCFTAETGSACWRRSTAVRGPTSFTAADEQLLRAFAASAANAVAIRRSVEAERLRSAIAAADAERGRWARELHDETLQALGGLRVLLASTLRPRRRRPPKTRRCARRSTTSSSKSRTCGASSPTCGRRCSTTSGCCRRSRRCSNAARRRARDRLRNLALPT